MLSENGCYLLACVQLGARSSGRHVPGTRVHNVQTPEGMMRLCGIYVISIIKPVCQFNHIFWIQTLWERFIEMRRCQVKHTFWARHLIYPPPHIAKPKIYSECSLEKIQLKNTFLGHPFIDSGNYIVHIHTLLYDCWNGGGGVRALFPDP